MEHDLTSDAEYREAQNIIYAVVGAVVADWLGGFNGLGVCMTRMKKAYAFDTMFGIIIFIVVISLLLLLAVKLVSKLCMPWRRLEEGE